MSRLGQPYRLAEHASPGRGALLVVCLAGLLAGCATAGPKKVTEILWPEPPLKPRIKFVGLLRNEDDLRATGTEKSVREWFSETILGAKKIPSSLRQPMGVALSHDGKRLYVTDLAKPGAFVFDFETRQMRPLGGEAFEFQAPLGVASDAQDNVYVVDSRQKLVRVFDPRGALARTITHESLERPTGIAIDPARQRLYVADSSTAKSSHHVIHVFDLEGRHLSTVGGLGSAAGQFSFPTYLTVDGQGNLYVADTMNGRIQVLDPGGNALQTIGEHGDAYGMFDKPKGVALDSFGNVYVADSSWSNVQIFNPQGKVLLFFGGRGRVPGLLFNPTGLAIDKDNRIYVADAFNERVSIYQLINTAAEDSFVSLPPQPAGHGGGARE